MKLNELDRVSNASVALEIADTLLFDFYEDYLTDRDYHTLKYEAENRPYMISAKIEAIMHFLEEARGHIERAENEQTEELKAQHSA